VDASQINTPPWADKALWLAVLTPILTALSAKLGVQLDPAALVGLVVPVVVYIAAHKWKTTTLARELIRADNGPIVTTAPTPGAVPPSTGQPPRPTGFADVRALFALCFVGLVLLLCLWSTPARASTVDLAVGPSQPAVVVRPGEPHPISLLPGAGVSIGADLLPGTLLGVPLHLLSLGGDLFGSVQAALLVAGAAAVALHVVLAELLVLMAGLDLVRSDGTGLFTSQFSSRNLLFGVGIDFGFLSRIFAGHVTVTPAPLPAMPPVPNGPPIPNG
jgi:hypothetical protein